MINKITAYIKSSLEEMKKVTWPTKKQTREYIVLVIAISLGVATFLGALDFIFNIPLEKIIQR
ncbi:MAG: preprotein translocase subunit SecE [Patescibacteria group bacterium]|jgi:preprotein translocase subunit SecE